jgi:hypothetical protein
VQQRIEALSKFQNFNDEMFIWLCKDIAAEIKQFGGSPKLKEQLKELVHGRARSEQEARRLSGK